jgi:Tfp pilus assembly protein PilO
MRSNERTIIAGVALVALALGFYLLLLAPKRDKAGELKDQINQLNGSITAAEQQVTYGEQARKDFPKYYGRMVVLGKAVPAQADTASLLVQLNSLAGQAHTKFQAIALSQGGSGGGSEGSSSTASPTSPAGAASTASSASTTAASSSSTSSSSTGTGASSSSSTAATPTATPAPATEASAATLPIGSVVGTAGLPTLPYTLTAQGDYFEVANFIGEVDGLVQPVDNGTQLSPDGRLLTMNGFGLQIHGVGPSPKLKANFVITAYSAGDLGLTAGASASGPAAPTSPGETDVQPASAVVSK